MYGSFRYVSELNWEEIDNLILVCEGMLSSVR
jgi:hypothetical protein